MTARTAIFMSLAHLVLACCPASTKSPGCSVLSVENCVCGFDPFCCTTLWDTQCEKESSTSCPCPPRPRPTGPRRVIIDTDVDIDDMMAINFMLRHPEEFEILAITVTPNGWSSQYSGVTNVMRLTQMFNQSGIPVAYGKLGALTNVADVALPSDFPPLSWYLGVNDYLDVWVPVPWCPIPADWRSAAQLIGDVLRENSLWPDEEKVDVIALGPVTNLAEAIHAHSDLWVTQVGSVYFSGGKFMTEAQFLDAMQDPSPPTWPFPATGMYGADWNTYLDPIAFSQLLAVKKHVGGVLHRPNFVAVTSNAQHALYVTYEDAPDNIPAACPPQLAEFLTQFTANYAISNNQSLSEVYYWDPSVPVLLYQLVRESPSSPGPFCTENITTKALLSLRNNATYSWFMESDVGDVVEICLDLNRTVFLQTYYAC